MSELVAVAVFQSRAARPDPADPARLAIPRRRGHFAGQPEVKKEVIEKVASYGKQLGIFTDVLLALAGDAPDKKEARLERLRDIAMQVEKVKAGHKADLAASAKQAMESLAKNDAAAARKIAAEYAR